MVVVENTPWARGDQVLSCPRVDPEEINSAPFCLHLVSFGFVSGVHEHDLLAECCNRLQTSVPSGVFIAGST